MRPRIIVITGPTGVGKSGVAAEIAKIWNGEIINADASQIRRQLAIGTAKPDLSKVEVKHHLFDIIDAWERFSVKDYQTYAQTTIQEVIKNNKLPIVVGGTGLYIASLVGAYPLDGLTRDPLFSLKFEHLTNEQLHDELKKIDLNKSLSIHPNNRRRVLRALELHTNPPAFEQKSVEPLFEGLIICLTTERSQLYERLNARVEAMLEMGWINEVKQLIKANIDVSTLQEIGYAEIKDYLDGIADLDFTKQIIKQKTRNYAKRQMTWFRNKLSCRFVVNDFCNPKMTLNLINEEISNFLQSEEET